MKNVATDRHEFEAVVLRCQDAVCAMAYAVLRDRARSEEIAQEAFLLAWQQQRTAPAWICGVARNLARNAARRRTEVTMVDEPPASAPDAREALISREAAARAAAALATLPDRDREALVLYYRADESMERVAEALGCSRDTAKQRVHRGRLRLRDALAPVEVALRATRPGAAFTAAVVAAWSVRPVHAAAAPRWVAPLPLAGAAAAAIAVAVGAAVVVHARAAAPGAPSVAATAAPPGRGGATPLTARFPAGPARHRAAPPRRLVLAPVVGGAPDPTAAKTVDLDFKQAPVRDLLGMLSDVLDAPMLVEPTIGGAIDIKDTALPALDALDQLLAQVGAERTEVPAIRLVRSGGRVDAAELGGDPVSMHVKDAPLDDVVAALAPKLQLPIGRLAGDDDAPALTVTLDVDQLAAGAALERVLAQTHLGYQPTTGFVVTPVAP